MGFEISFRDNEDRQWAEEKDCLEQQSDWELEAKVGRTREGAEVDMAPPLRRIWFRIGRGLTKEPAAWMA